MANEDQRMIRIEIAEALSEIRSIQRDIQTFAVLTNSLHTHIRELQDLLMGTLQVLEEKGLLNAAEVMEAKRAQEARRADDREQENKEWVDERLRRLFEEEG